MDVSRVDLVSNKGATRHFCGELGFRVDREAAKLCG